MYRVMGIDPSTTTGLAVMGFEEPMVAPVLLANRELMVRGKEGMQRAERIGGVVDSAIREFHPNLIIIEGYGFGNQHTLATLVEIGTMIRYRIRKAGITYLEVPPTSLKKFVTGSGVAKKEKIMLAVFQRWGIECATDNMADAVGLAFFGGALLGLVAMPRQNMDAVHALVKKNLLAKKLFHREDQ